MPGNDNPFLQYVYETVAGFCGTIASSISSSITDIDCIKRLFDDPKYK